MPFRGGKIGTSRRLTISFRSAITGSGVGTVLLRVIWAKSEYFNLSVTVFAAIPLASQ
ncbi:hypothetical protein AMC83_PD00023 (plasmid) [Rhizobium phaseoli]|uniref:Uncharacterized protein n=1 Tax=Rhizobium aethiopicum TaxID=1138170 RepID=A0A1C3YA04_9HYPH|nr:hypothetical protein AMK02_PC00023 [Rhizobium sp. N731]ANL18515.1 hypothetical protein AMJ97_PC00023 [Rhizobium sp. N1314]ANL37105.1 hypothetical protein AMC89_PC00023 [Rhizobium phaseoli]SCB61290.1 hypothetical protein GA0061105_11695 [Rhizobium aethiopicum]ANL43483.1 hypothetical protein AMC88_PC00023 [Rhizobium phaseoli]